MRKLDGEEVKLDCRKRGMRHTEDEHLPGGEGRLGLHGPAIRGEGRVSHFGGLVLCCSVTGHPFGAVSWVASISRDRKGVRVDGIWRVMGSYNAGQGS